MAKLFSVTATGPEAEGGRSASQWFARRRDGMLTYGPFSDRETAESVAQHHNHIYEQFKNVDLAQLHAEILREN